jgi:hypothetical protein
MQAAADGDTIVIDDDNASDAQAAPGGAEATIIKKESAHEGGAEGVLQKESAHEDGAEAVVKKESVQEDGAEEARADDASKAKKRRIVPTVVGASPQ